MNRFKEFQFGRPVVAPLLAAEILFAYLFLTNAGNNPMTPGSFFGATGANLIVCLLFYGMTTTIEGDVLRITYGIGLIRRTIQLSEIRSAEVVRNPWIYGWGIRFIPNGMLYNIKGLAGVELTFKSRSRIIRIGSGNADALSEAISKEITRR